MIEFCEKLCVCVSNTSFEHKTVHKHKKVGVEVNSMTDFVFQKIILKYVMMLNQKGREYIDLCKIKLARIENRKKKCTKSEMRNEQDYRKKNVRTLTINSAEC